MKEAGKTNKEYSKQVYDIILLYSKPDICQANAVHHPKSNFALVDLSFKI